MMMIQKKIADVRFKKNKIDKKKNTLIKKICTVNVNEYSVKC